MVVKLPCPWTRRAPSDRPHERLDYPRIEPRARVGPRLPDGGGDAHGRAVGAVRGHCVEGVAGGDDPRLDPELLSGQAVGVAAAVPALVREPYDTAHLAHDAAHALQQPLAVECVHLMSSHSAWVSGPGLLMISLGTAILPTSCSSAPNSTLRRRGGRKAQLIGHLESQTHDGAAVKTGVLVAGLHDVGRHHGRAPVGVTQLEGRVEAGLPLTPEPGRHSGSAGSHRTKRRCAPYGAAAKRTSERPSARWPPRR
jgi:hypothetical protein